MHTTRPLHAPTTTRIFPSDQVLALLVTRGPSTLEQLAAWCQKDPYRVNGYLYTLRTRGFVELIERDQHLNRFKMKCGKWRAVPK